MQGSALRSSPSAPSLHHAIILDAVTGFAAAAGAKAIRVGGIGFGVAAVADAVENRAPAIDRKGVRGGKVPQKGTGLLTLQMLQLAADQTFQVKMRRAAAVLAHRLIVSYGRTRVGVGSVKASEQPLLAQAAKLAVKSADGNGLVPPFGGRKMSVQRLCPVLY